MRLTILVPRRGEDPPWEPADLDTAVEGELGLIVDYVESAIFEGDIATLASIYQQVLQFEPSHESTGRTREDDEQEAERLQAYLASAIEDLLRRKITTLLYDAARHGWDSEECRRRRAEIESTHPDFKGYAAKQYATWIQKKETEERTYYGEAVSDDSDSESEDGESDDEYVRRTYRMAKGGVYPLGNDVRNGMPKAFRAPFKPGKVMRGEDEWGNLATENAAIHHPDDVWNEQVEADLEAVNLALAKGDPRVDTLTKTRFCVAQYRGIAYNVVSFNAAARRANRELFELRMPVYSASVFHACGVSPGDFYAGRCPSETAERLHSVAERLRAILLAKRESGPIRIGERTFESHAYALQDFYTKDYDGFHRELGEYFASLQPTDMVDQGGEPAEDPPRPARWELFEGLLNARNPFVSTGNTPRHALRYAYGVKYYEGHGHERLRPRWRRDGRAERPYSGKVYVSLHPVSDYLFGGPLDVVSLNRQGKINVISLISAERESSFPAYIPEDRVVAEHIARYPSFSHRYRDHYIHKYGLTEDEYDLFRKRIIETRPHSAPHRKNKRALGEWLVRYYEVRLIETARRIAAERGMVLVYRDEAGFLTRVLPTQVGPASQDAARSSGGGGKESSNKLDMSSPAGLEPPSRDEMPQLEKVDLLSYEMVEQAHRRAAAFEKWLRERFDLRRTPPDGNCLFHALAAALDSYYTHEQLRERAVRQLQDEGGELREGYLDDMALVAEHALQTERWGSDLEVGAIARHLQINIRIYAPGDFDGYTDLAGNPHDDAIAAYLYHVGGNHWEWMEPKSAQAVADRFE